MSYDEPEYDLLAAFKARFGISSPSAADSNEPPDTKVLSSAEHIYNEAIDISVSMTGTKAAAKSIYALMRERSYSTRNWCEHELHPDPAVMGEEETVKFIFTTDLLNFCFWSQSAHTLFTVEYKGKQWTGYYSVVAALRRALDEDIPITSSDFWQSEEECTDEVLRHVFRSATAEEIPMFAERAHCLRTAGHVLYSHYKCSPLALIRTADNSARRLVHILTAADQPFAQLFADTAQSPPRSGHTVYFYKRAQILVADLWACFGGSEGSPGYFTDIDALTMFPDYRIPQMLCALGVLVYSPPLASRISRGEELESGGIWEVEIRGCAVWAVELLRREILELQQNGDEGDLESSVDGQGFREAEENKELKTKTEVNAVLIDFFLYDLCKEKEKLGELDDVLPHHRTKSIWY